MAIVNLYNPSELSRDEWGDLQALSRSAFKETLHRSQDEIDVLVAWDDADGYLRSHLDPNTHADASYVPNQEYFNPRVAVATEGNQLAGYAYSAHSVSGQTASERFMKRMMVRKCQLWLREFAVLPALQKHGLAKQMGKVLLHDAVALQPPSTDIWPDESGFLQGALERIGFVPVAEKQVQVFGVSSEPIRQVRMQAPSVRGVLQRL